MKENLEQKNDLAPLTEASFNRGLEVLAQRDRDLARVLSTLGPPPLWKRTEGFPTLLRIILEQQVSLASAKAAFDRVRAAVPALTPLNFLALNDSELKQFGFSRQKTNYARNLARAIQMRELRLSDLGKLAPAEIRDELTRIKGIGTWTADIYILMALRRQDAWPTGDLAIAVGIQKLKRLKSRPSSEQLEAMSRQWKPWRAVAARIIWHYYLETC